MLENEDKVHKEQFKNVKLYNVFPVTINYHFQKLTDLSCIKTFIKGNFEIIKKALEDFKEELKRRDCLEAYDGVNFIFENLIYPMNKLDKYFRNEIELVPTCIIDSIYVYCRYETRTCNSTIGRRVGDA